MSRTQHRPAGDPATSLIRPACARDLEALQDFFAGLSTHTRYLRFFAPLRPSAAMLRYLSGGGSVHATVAVRRNGVIIGHAMAADQARAAGTTTDIGVVVADTWQGRGVGSALMRPLIAGARARGVTTLGMDVLASNPKVLAMIATHWPEARIDQSGCSVTICAGIDQAMGGPPRQYQSLRRTPASC